MFEECNRRSGASVVGDDIVRRVEACSLRVEPNEKKIENTERTERCPRLES